MIRVRNRVRAGRLGSAVLTVSFQRAESVGDSSHELKATSPALCPAETELSCQPTRLGSLGWWVSEPASNVSCLRRSQFHHDEGDDAQRERAGWPEGKRAARRINQHGNRVAM